VDLAATKGTTQPPALWQTAIAGMGEKENAAILATNQTAPQAGMGLQDDSDDPIVGQNKIARHSLAVPLRPILKMPRDLYSKKPSRSLTRLKQPAAGWAPAALL
jgi:hypothetical protein